MKRVRPPFFVSSIALALLLASPGVAAPRRRAKPTPADPVERLRMAVDAGRFASHRHFEWKGTSRRGEGADGAGIRIEGAWERRGRGFVATVDPAGNRAVLGFDGERAWQLLPGGALRIPPPSEQRRIRTELFRLLPAFPFPPGFRAKIVATDPDHGRFRVEPDGGEPIELETDPKSGRPMASPTPNGQRIEWREWGRPLSPSLVVVVAAGRIVNETRQTAPTFDRLLPDGFFDRPGRGYRFDRPEGSVILPFAGRGLFPIVEAGLSGERLRLALDFDSPLSRLTPAAARRVEPGGAGGRMVAGRVTFPGLAVDGVSFEVDVEGRVDDVAARMDEPIDGLLGAAFLLRFSGVVDFERSRIRLVDPDVTSIPSAGERVVPMRELGGRPLLVASFSGRGAGSAVDLLRDLPLVLPGSLLRDAGLAGGTPVRGPKGGARVLLTHEFVLGEARLPGMTALVEDEGDRSDRGASPRLGLSFFTGGYFVWEPEKGQARWRKGEGSDRNPLARGGFELERRAGRLVVVALADDGPAARAGLSLGDELVELEGRGIGGISLESIRTSFSRAPGSVARFAVDRNGEKRVVEIVLGDLARLPEVAAPAK
jgi:hypothetical protein